jgi:GH43 family beta-xylosidase
MTFFLAAMIAVVSSELCLAQPGGKVAPKPLFRDPVHDGAADPVVIWNRVENKWLMFYTNRRANVPNLAGVSWVHGTRIGMAESTDGGATWKYAGTAAIAYGKPDYSYWAPEIVEYDGVYHMYLSVVSGTFKDWNADRQIVHLTSKDLRRWDAQSALDLGSDRVIDATVIEKPGGGFRMWYKNERARDGSVYYADSTVLNTWSTKGNAIPGVSGEGPKVFRWKDRYWMMVDVWDGIAVFSSSDCLRWTRQPDNLLKQPGVHPTDRSKGGHVDVVVSGDRAYMFYFVHQRGPDAAGKDAEWQRHTVIQVVELTFENGRIACDRNAPARIALLPPQDRQSQAARIGLKLGDFYLHDPFVLAHKPTRTYYLYNSAGPRQTGSGRFGLLVYKSKDLETWEGPRVIFEIPDGLWANPAHGLWAPEVHEYHGKYYLFATLHNRDKLLGQPPDELLAEYNGAKAKHHMRGTQIFAGDSPEGPFRPLSNSPAAPADFMTLDGTLYVEDGVPYMVYAHEWIQILDGTMEAVRLKPDLSGAVGEPIYLFKASDAPWLREQTKASNKPRTYVTDGPQLYRTKTGKLLMLWSSYRDGLYVETIAHSESGQLKGPWRQGEVLVGNDSGHGMIFESFDGRLMLILHQPFRQARGKLFEIEDIGDTVRIKRQLVY